MQQNNNSNIKHQVVVGTMNHDCQEACSTNMIHQINLIITTITTATTTANIYNITTNINITITTTISITTLLL